MRIFGTKCPHCGRLQLALGEQLAFNVKCVHCARMFVCLDETGDLPFVKSPDNESVSVCFAKQITRAFFEYGIGIPPSMHDMVRSRLSKVLSLGEKAPAVVMIGSEKYPIEIKSFENHRGAICLHLLWTARSGIKKALAAEYADAYRYYVTQGGDAKHPEWKVEVSVTTEGDVFALDEDRFARRRLKTANRDFDMSARICKGDAEFLEALLK